VEAGGEALKRVAASTPSRRAGSRRGPVALDWISRPAVLVTDQLRRKPWLATTLAVVAILAASLALRLSRHPPVAPVSAPSLPLPAVATAPPPPAPAPTARPQVPETRVADKPKPAAAPPRPAPARKSDAPAKPPAASAAAPAPPAPPAPAVTAKAPEPAAKTPVAKAEPESRPPAQAGSGALLLTIRPWGEVYVDGVHRGDAPPLYELRVAAGKRRLEIRHPDFPPYLRNLDVAPGAKIEVRHTFLPKEYPNPLRKLWK
jgi:hypothetical protein